jgi:hypothetical protein
MSGCIRLGMNFLNGNCAFESGHNARKLRNDPVARRIGNASRVSLDQIVHPSAAGRAEKRPFLVRPHETRAARDICRDDRGEAAWNAGLRNVHCFGLAGGAAGHLKSESV